MPVRAQDHLDDQEALKDLADAIAKMEPLERARFIRSLLPQQRMVVERAVAIRWQAGWRATPATFAHYLDPKGFQLYRHVEYLAQKFVDAVEGTSPRQLWNLPGRYTKTSVLRWGCAWGYDRVPSSRWIWSSYGDALALESGYAILSILRAHADEVRVQLSPDRKARDRFTTTGGGGLLAAGIDTAITGFGCGDGGGLIVDDPFKNWAEAHSEANRDRVMNQYLGTLRNRLDDESAPIIIAHHRMHEDDITGRLVAEGLSGDGDKWEVVALPALAMENDPLGRQPGEPLWPERFPLEAIEARHVALGSYLTSALEQQDPQPEEGNDIKRAWFRLASQLPPRYDDALSSSDMKLKDKEAGDFFVCQVWGRVGAELYVVDQLRGQWDQATCTNAIALIQVRYPWVHRHIVENTGNGPEVMIGLRKPEPSYVVSDETADKLGMTGVEREAVQSLRRRGMQGILPENPRGDKRVRMRAQIPVIEAGHVHLLSTASFLPGFLDEMASFPLGKDDQVDAASQALKRLGQGAASFEVPQSRMENGASIQRSSPSGFRIPRRRGLELQHPLPD
jgi:hypothetical protein